MLALLLLIPLFAGLLVGANDGVLAGLAAGAVATVFELLLLTVAGLLAKRREARRQAALAAEATSAADTALTQTDAPAPTSHLPDAPAPSRAAEFHARRPDDRLRPIDLLPDPIGTRWPSSTHLGHDQRLPGDLRDYASYQRISVDIDPRTTSAAAVYRELYDGLRQACEKHVDVESNLREARPEIAPLDDLPENYQADKRADDTLFVAFRTRDAQWAGFRLGQDSFRFPLDRLAGFALNVGIPARGGGGYEIETVFDRPRRNIEADADWQWHGSAFQPTLPYADRHSFALLYALTTIAQLFDVRIVCSTFSDC